MDQIFAPHHICGAHYGILLFYHSRVENLQGGKPPKNGCASGAHVPSGVATPVIEFVSFIRVFTEELNNECET